MDKGTYSAASSGLVQLRKLDVVTHNLANVNTPGFKRQLLVSEKQSFDQTLAKLVEPNDPYARGDHERTPGIGHLRTTIDFTPGSVKNTGNPLDLALRHPNDFFVVNTPDGVQYTRAGNFTLNAEGNLVTADGMEVQGDGGPITAPGPGVMITPGGVVTSNRVEVGRVQVVRIEKPEELESVDGTRFKLKGGAAPEAVDADVIPESLEMGNMSVIGGMVEMISANRAFEMYTRTAQSIDQLNQMAINQVGRAR
jgi:flagellar basal-body rod protein FlgF